MNLSDAIYRTVHSAIGGLEALAIRMNIRTQIMRNKANPNSGANYFSPAELDLLMALTGDHSVLHALAQNHGYVCIKVESEMAQSDMAILEVFAKAVAANGEVGAELYATLADGMVEQHEVARVEEAAYRAKAAVTTMVNRLKGMAEK